MATPKELMAASQNTVIGPSILISGKLQGDEDLTVRGRVEGELSLSKTLIVETSGIVKANVSVKNAIVSGVVVGNITASESVELTREGRMVGDIHSPRVILVDGASFRGQIDMGEATAGRPAQDRGTVRPLVRPSGAPVARPLSTPAPMARPTPPPTRPAATVVSRPAGKAPAPPPPPKLEKAAPSPVSVAEGGKKRVVIKKKAR